MHFRFHQLVKIWQSGWGAVLLPTLIALMVLNTCQDVPMAAKTVDLVSPAALHVQVLDAERVQLTWQNMSLGAAGVRIDRKLAEEYLTLAELGPHENEFIDSTAPYGHWLYYRSVSYAGGGSEVYAEDSVALVYLNTGWSLVDAGAYRYGIEGELRSDIDYAYEMMTYEVTNRQYVEYLQEALDLGSIIVTPRFVLGYHDRDTDPGVARAFYELGDTEANIHHNGVDFEIEAGYEDAPVSEVTWYGAYGFARHYGLDLPTEPEWEKAARGTSMDPFPWGGGELSCDLANTAGCGADVVTVGSTSGVSPFGVYDLAGNVWEWVDGYVPTDSTRRVLRGGGCASSESFVRVYSRGSHDAWHSSYFFGFRCIRR